jgi:hypothetical protein
MSEHMTSAQWHHQMAEMIGALRPDLVVEFNKRCSEPLPSRVGDLLDEHFSIAPEHWGMLSVAQVPAIFRERFLKS